MKNKPKLDVFLVLLFALSVAVLILYRIAATLP